MVLPNLVCELSPHMTQPTVVKTEVSLSGQDRTFPLYRFWKFADLQDRDKSLGMRKLGRRSHTCLGKVGRTVWVFTIHLPTSLAGLLCIDLWGMRIDFHRIPLLILLDHWMAELFSSLATCKLLSKAWTYSTECLAEFLLETWERDGKGLWHWETGSEILYKSFLVNQI